MHTLIYEYKNKQIEFLLGADMMVNATEMAAIYNKRVVDFLRRPETKTFIDALEKSAIREFKGAESAPLNSGNEVFTSQNTPKGVNFNTFLITIPGREGATWMHRWLAIDFAMWLDVHFKIWIIEKIDYLLINFSNKHRELIDREQELKKQRIKMLQENADNPILLQLAKIDDELKSVSHKKSSITKSQYGIWNNLEN